MAKVMGTKKEEVQVNEGSKRAVNVQSTTRTLNAANDRNAFWYLQHEGDDVKVTDEAVNLDLGIKEIRFFKPSQKQEDIGVIVAIRLDTVFGTISGIQVKESKNTPGALYVQTGSKNIGTVEQPTWLNEVKLNRDTQAQILKYVETLLTPVEK